MIQQKPKIDQNTQELDIYKRAEPYSDKQNINNEEFFVCKWNECHFIAKNMREVSLHIGFKHLQLYDCSKKYVQLPQTPQINDFQAFSFANNLLNTREKLIPKEKNTKSKKFHEESVQSYKDNKKGVWKPFKCHYDYCSLRFITLDVMRNHLKVHESQN